MKQGVPQEALLSIQEVRMQDFRGLSPYRLKVTILPFATLETLAIWSTPARETSWDASSSRPGTLDAVAHSRSLPGLRFLAKLRIPGCLVPYVSSLCCWSDLSASKASRQPSGHQTS